MRNISKIAAVSGIAIGSFVLGSLDHEYERGSVRIYHSMDEHTWLNHGQPSIEVKLPSGVIFTQEDFVFNPHWRADGKADRIYFDSFSIEQKLVRPPEDSGS